MLITFKLSNWFLLLCFHFFHFIYVYVFIYVFDSKLNTQSQKNFTTWCAFAMNHLKHSVLTTSKGHIWIKEIVLPHHAHQVSQITANASELFTTWCTMNHLKHSVSTTWSVLGRVRKFAFRQLQLQRLPISKFTSGSQFLHDEQCIQKMNPMIFSHC